MKQNYDGIETILACNYNVFEMKLRWDCDKIRNEVEMKLTWNWNEIEMKLKWNWNEIEMKFKWNWDKIENQMEMKWNWKWYEIKT